MIAETDQWDTDSSATVRRTDPKPHPTSFWIDFAQNGYQVSFAAGSRDAEDFVAVRLTMPYGPRTAIVTNMLAADVQKLHAWLSSWLGVDHTDELTRLRARVAELEERARRQQALDGERLRDLLDMVNGY